MKGDFSFGALVREPDGARCEIPVDVPADLRYFDGHFAGNPMLPGVAQVVALAEAGARMAFPDLGAAAGLRRVKFMEAIRPGDALVVVVERDGERVGFRIQKQGREASRGSLLFR